MDIKNVKSFLEYDNKPLKNDFILPCIIINAMIFYIGAYFSSQKIINIIVVSCINIIVFFSFVYVHKSVNKCQYRLKMLHGIFFLEFCISCNYLAYQFLLPLFRCPLLLCLLLIFLIMCSGGAVFLFIIYGIKTGRYNNKKGPSSQILVIIFGSILFAFILTLRFFSESLTIQGKKIIWGVLLVLIGMAFTSGIIPIIKYHFYKLIENQK